MRETILAAALALSGCSMVFMETLDDDRDIETIPTCTSSKALTYLDVFISTLAASAAVTAFDAGDSRSGTGLVLDSGIYLISAFIGDSWANDCRSARQAHQDWVLSRMSGRAEVTPQPLPKVDRDARRDLVVHEPQRRRIETPADQVIAAARAVLIASGQEVRSTSASLLVTSWQEATIKSFEYRFRWRVLASSGLLIVESECQVAVGGAHRVCDRQPRYRAEQAGVIADRTVEQLAAADEVENQVPNYIENRGSSPPPSCMSPPC